MADSKSLTGFKELANSLRQLGPRVAKNRLRRAVSAGAAVIRNEAKQIAPVDTGEMRRDIQIKRERDSRSGDLIVRYSVFVRTGGKSRLSGRGRNVDKNSFYWRFVEFGTSKMAAKPFMRPAYESKKEDAVDTIGTNLREGIEAEVKAMKK